MNRIINQFLFCKHFKFNYIVDCLASSTSPNLSTTVGHYGMTTNNMNCNMNGVGIGGSGCSGNNSAGGGTNVGGGVGGVGGGTGSGGGNGSPYKVQRQQTNVRERKRMLRSAPNGYHYFELIYQIWC